MINSHKISYAETTKFGKLALDYLADNFFLNSWRGGNLQIPNLINRAIAKQQSFSENDREILVSELQHQMHDFELTPLQKSNLDALNKPKTLTITTGHQLSLLGGQAYFFYKIASTINLCNTLNNQQTEFRFVPVFWLASEDHDFEEINHITVENEKFIWEKKAKGPVGKLDLEGTEAILKKINTKLIKKKFGTWIEDIINKYGNETNLANATKQLVHALFSDFGLLAIDGNSKVLKQQFAKYVKAELKEGFAQTCIANANAELLQHGYDAQVFARPINLFYLGNGNRERIEPHKDGFQLSESRQTFSNRSFFELLEKQPEDFSPNAILRPLYQEVVLPNIAYLGGAAEVAYWMQIKPIFDYWNLPFPAVLLRNSAGFVPEKVFSNAKKSGIPIAFGFQNITIGENKLIASHVPVLPVDKVLDQIRSNLGLLPDLASETNLNLSLSAKAASVRINHILKQLRHKAIKAEKEKHKILLNRLSVLNDALLHNGVLRERVDSPLAILARLGPKLVEFWVNHLNPLEREFIVISYVD